MTWIWPSFQFATLCQQATPFCPLNFFLVVPFEVNLHNLLPLWNMFLLLGKLSWWSKFIFSKNKHMTSMLGLYCLDSILAVINNCWRYYGRYGKAPLLHGKRAFQGCPGRNKITFVCCKISNNGNNSLKTWDPSYEHIKISRHVTSLK